MAKPSAIEIVPVECLSDNYAYLMHDGESGRTLVVDPSEAEPVWRELQARAWKLDFVLNTHHHHDHVGGNAVLKERTGCQVFAPAANKGQIPALDHGVTDGEIVELGAIRLRAISIPGHTLGHTAYYCETAQAVFTGDTLFLMGCGRLFEGTPSQMWDSLGKLARLPADTRVYCGHEYTVKNGEFALTLEPDNAALRERLEQMRARRRNKEPSVPGLLSEELATNPFLRVKESGLQKAVGMIGASPAEVLGEVRRRKDSFR